MDDYGIFVLQRGDGHCFDVAQIYIDKYGNISHSGEKLANHEISFTIDII